MRYKSSKLKKLERQRYSIFVEDLSRCVVCGGNATDIHEVYNGSNRKTSMKYGFCLPLCRRCHSYITFDSEQNKKLKQWGQKEFEKKHSREEFIKIIGKNYLED